MNAHKFLLACLVLLPALALSTRGQSTFQNLNFESANLSGYPVGDSHVPIGSALPGWQGHYGTNATAEVWYDGISLGGVMVSVIDTNAPFSNKPIAGRYSAFLFGDPTFYARISQIGLIPFGAVSLRMQTWPSGANFVVSIGGQEIQMTALDVQTNYTVYGGDISAFAGDVVELSITANQGPLSSSNAVELDSILFSTIPIPEPEVWSLMLLGPTLCIRRPRKRKTRVKGVRTSTE